jgi:hypothetical protein
MKILDNCQPGMADLRGRCGWQKRRDEFGPPCSALHANTVNLETTQVAIIKERTLKKALIYFLAFMVGGIIGILILGHIPDSLSFLNNGPLNFPIFGAIGFGICPIVYKEYKKLLLVPVIAFVIGLAILVFLFQGG